ncbi:MAG: 1-acyl-sn-glycerol-3-phosphate acyltransferase, partial [Planctomycetes bacterium]|nr:1-acyl-sn-glycerol-3-phosphate acyltransferase [Planctomycetota bacterium]
AEADASVFLCAATTGAGFGVLVLASHPVLFSIGATGLAGIASCLVVTALYVPPLAGRLLLSPGTNGAPGVRNLATAAWVLAVTVGRAAWFLVVERWLVRPERRERAALAALRSIARAFRFHLPIGRQIYSGREPIGDEGPFVIVSNHESIYDSFAALSLPIPVHILVKGWVWKTPLVRRMIRAAGFIPSDDLEFEEILQRARESMARGISVLVFPEGTRGDGLRLRRFHRGAFTIARRLGARVLPIAVANSGTMSRRGGFWVNHHEVRVEVLDPLDPQAFAFAGEDGDRLMAREARRRILETRERLRREASEGAEWLRVIAGMYRYQGPVIGYYAASKVKRDPLVLALPSLSREDGEGGDGDADRGGPAGADACVQDRVSAGEDERERNGAGEGERKRRGSGEDERKRRGSGEDERERRGSGEDERERRRGGDVLVAGCGYGILTARLALAFPRRQILAVDADECKIEVARAVLSECPGARLEAGDVREVDIGEPRLALLVDVLHYWPEEAQRSIVERLAAAMPQGARLIFRDGCRDAGRSHRWVHAGERLAGRIGFTRFEGGLHFRSEAEWAGLLQECGFAIEERRPDLGLLSNLVLVARRERGRDAAPADGRDAAR